MIDGSVKPQALAHGTPRGQIAPLTWSGPMPEPLLPFHSGA
jgi:hypothetical protein